MTITLLCNTVKARISNSEIKGFPYIISQYSKKRKEKLMNYPEAM